MRPPGRKKQSYRCSECWFWGYWQVCSLLWDINKIDVLPYFDFDVEKCKEYIKHRNPNAKIFLICAKTGEGIEEWSLTGADTVSRSSAVGCRE